MRENVIAAHDTVKRFHKELTHYFEIITAYLGPRFRFFDAGGRLVDKTHCDWRTALQGGAHGAGDAISFASDISGRTLHETMFPHALILYYAGWRGAEGHGDLPTSVVVDAYLESLMLNLRYDRRFLPGEYINQHHQGEVLEYLKKVKGILRAEIDPEHLEMCAGFCNDARKDVEAGRVQMLQDYREFLDEKMGASPMGKVTSRIIQQMQQKVLETRRRDAVRATIAAKLARKA